MYSICLRSENWVRTDNGERSEEGDEWYIDERGLETIVPNMFCGGVAREARDAGDDNTRDHHVSHRDQNR